MLSMPPQLLSSILHDVTRHNSPEDLEEWMKIIKEAFRERGGDKKSFSSSFFNNLFCFEVKRDSSFRLGFIPGMNLILMNLFLHLVLKAVSIYPLLHLNVLIIVKQKIV